MRSQVNVRCHNVILLVGHGTRLPVGLNEFHTFCDEVERRVRWGYSNERLRQLRDGEGCLVRLTFDRAFLEIAVPNLLEALKRCGRDNPERILLVPMFLFDAGHMKVDIPAMIQQAAPALEDTEIRLLPSIGVDSGFAAVAVERLLGTLQRNGNLLRAQTPLRDLVLTIPSIRESSVFPGAMREGPLFPDDAVILLLGRGNKDNEAQAEFERVADTIRELLRLNGLACSLLTGYLAGTGQSWKDVLAAVAHSGARTVYILPYLWFHGWLTDRLPIWASDWKSTFADFADLEIVICDPLGVHPTLVHRVARRVVDALVEPSTPSMRS